MAAPVESRTLVDTGGLVVIDDGRRVLVFDRCTGALTVLAFLLGVLTLVVGGFGLVALVAGIPSRALGAAFLTVGLVLAAVTFVVVRRIRGRRSQPLHDCRPVAVAVTPGGTKVLKRGNPFDGGVGNVDEVLTAVVHSS